MDSRINTNINAVNLTMGTRSSSSSNNSTNTINSIKSNYSIPNEIEEISFEETYNNYSIESIDMVTKINNYLETARLINDKNIEVLTNERDRLQDMYEEFLIPVKEENEKYKFAAIFSSNPDIPYIFQPTDEMRLSPFYEKYIQEHSKEFEEFMGMSFEEYNLRIQELNSSITYLEAYDYTLRQEAKKIPYLEIEVTDDYQNYLSNLPSETQEVKIPREYLNSINYQTIEGYTIRTNYNAKYDMAISNFKYLNQDQINMYNYLFDVKGETAALDYLLAIEDSINQVKGHAEAMAFLQRIVNEDGSYDLNVSTFLNTAGKGLETGVETFFEGFENLMDFTGDGVKTDNQYAQMFILQELQKSGELDDKFLSGTFEVSTSIGNMLPASAISLTLNIIAPGSGEIVGNTLMGLSAAGNAKNDALISGSNRTQAYIYGLLTGTSEAVLGELLGNIPGLNTEAKFALLDILKEGGEELVQEYIDAGLRATILGESIDISELDAQALKSFFYGCISSGVMTGGQATINFTYNGVTYTVDKINQFVDLFLYNHNMLRNHNAYYNNLCDEMGISTVKRPLLPFGKLIATKYSMYDINSSDFFKELIKDIKTFKLPLSIFANVPMLENIFSDSRLMSNLLSVISYYEFEDIIFDRRNSPFIKQLIDASYISYDFGYGVYYGLIKKANTAEQRNLILNNISDRHFNQIILKLLSDDEFNIFVKEMDNNLYSRMDKIISKHLSISNLRKIINDNNIDSSVIETYMPYLNLFSKYKDLDFNNIGDIAFILKDTSVDERNFLIEKLDTELSTESKYELYSKYGIEEFYDEKYVSAVEYVRGEMLERMRKHFGSYVSEESILRLPSICHFLSESEFVQKGVADAAAFNSHDGSYMNLNCVLYVLNSIVFHESVHALARYNKYYTGFSETSRGFNEAVTEYLSEIAMEETYPTLIDGKIYCAYQPSISKLKKLINVGIINIEKLKQAYFNHDDSYIRDTICQLTDEETYNQMMKYFDVANELPVTYNEKLEALAKLDKIISDLCSEYTLGGNSNE